MFKINRAFALTLAISLMACASQRATPTVIAAANATPTPLPTFTPIPTETAVPTTATPEALPTPLPLLSALMLGPVTSTLKSPTNAYEATVVNTIGELETSMLLTIDGALGGNKWTVVREKKATAGTVLAMVPMGWSADERFFYFTRMVAGTGCEAFLSGSELSQANVATRKVRVFKYNTGGPMALSPDTTTLAHIVYEEQTPARARANRRATPTPTPVPDVDGPKMKVSLVLRDVGGRRTRSVLLSEGTDVNTFQAGGLVWKPDGSAVMLAYAYNACTADARYALVEINTKTLKPRLVLDKDAHLFTPQVWSEGGWVELLDREQKRWLLDPSNGTAVRAG